MKVLGIVGPSDAGKTTVIERLTEQLSKRGSVGTIKHLTHPPDIDQSGKDTHRHRSAGATVTVGITDDAGWFATGRDRTLDETIDEFAKTFDYCLIEGFGDSNVPKVVLDSTPDEYSNVLAVIDPDNSSDIEELLVEIEELEPYVTLQTLVDRVKRSRDADRAGAIATFTGRVREKDHPDDRPTEYLEFEKYRPIAEERLDRLKSELEARDGVFAVEFYHRTGLVERGEDIVHVVVLAGHRTEAFQTVEDGINRLKDEVPIFKKEVTVSEEFWVHDRAEH